MTQYQKLQKIIKNAYAPYSKFKVAAILETDAGDFLGVNVENASFSLTICAERSAITNAITHGAKDFKKLYLLTSSTKQTITPCGACRQVMAEFANANMPIYVYNNAGKSKKYTLKQLLPCTFKT
jgi:cytidine deaminase